MQEFTTNQDNWRPTIKQCLKEQWTRITEHLDVLPDEEHLDFGDLTEEQQQAVEYIEAIEGEWLVDPMQRAELSVLVFDEDEE